MALPNFVSALAGEWSGDSNLHLSWLEEEPRTLGSESRLTFQIAPTGAYALVDYTWTYKDEPQTGHLLLCGTDDGKLSAGWSDSWHQSTGVMDLQGTGQDNHVTVTGEYEVGEGLPNWGWRIEFQLTGDTLSLRMTNLMPDGPEDWAVEAIYKRA